MDPMIVQGLGFRGLNNPLFLGSGMGKWIP